MPVEQLHLPSPSDPVDRNDVWAWYRNIPMELSEGFLAEDESRCLADYYRSAGLLTEWRVNFFRRHFCDSFQEAASFLLDRSKAPHIIDLGCGTGTQSLYLALRGARITALDLDDAALKVFRERIAFYEKRLNKPLCIRVYRANALKFDYRAHAPIDGVYSMFAFNMMQPSAALIDAIVSGLGTGGRLAVIDGNTVSWVARLIRRRRRAAWSPQQFAQELEAKGFEIKSHKGCASLPPVLWLLGGRFMIRLIDQWFARKWLFAVSHQILAEHRGSPDPMRLG